MCGGTLEALAIRRTPLLAGCSRAYSDHSGQVPVDQDSKRCAGTAAHHHGAGAGAGAGIGAGAGVGAGAGAYYYYY